MATTNTTPVLSDTMRHALRSNHFSAAFDDTFANAARFHVGMTIADAYTAVKQGCLAERLEEQPTQDEVDAERAERDAHYMALKSAVYLGANHMMAELIDSAPEADRPALRVAAERLLTPSL